MFDDDDFFVQPYQRRYGGNPFLPTSFHRAAADWMDAIDQDFASFLNEREVERSQQRHPRRHKHGNQQAQPQQGQQQQLLNESKEESKDFSMTTTQDNSLSSNNSNNNSSTSLTSNNNNNSSLSMFSSPTLSFSSLRLKPTTSSDRYEYSTPVPTGLNKDQLELSIHANLLTLSANVKQEDRDKQGNLISSSYRQVSRCISLPEDADLQKINARYDNGQLLIQVGRVEQPRQHGQRIVIQ